MKQQNKPIDQRYEILKIIHGLFRKKSIPLHSDKTVGISYPNNPRHSRCFGIVVLLKHC
ncbi:hypothetical protein SAMN05421740_107126 [Parapedobacter koreensis]|uniref:Uncharacterized protein n=1 Tax=Parapedobacter koreensis TaxID=332977 RepID=A0A1H7RHX1_9SPHI|nr:hypothetical protein SAMN05421740_107126 [Parapedobacter koreensis]